MYYLQSRYYDSEVGRFISADSYAMTYETPIGANMFAYCGNNPVLREDFNGDYWETALDVVAVGVDIAQIATNPTNFVAWGALAADVACLVLPGATGGGGIVRFVATADKLADASKYADEVVDAGRAIKSTRAKGMAKHSDYSPVSSVNEGVRNQSIKKTFNVGNSNRRPDYVDMTNNVIYELKPYNKNSFLRAIQQTKDYLANIPDSTKFTVIIDMYFD